MISSDKISVVDITIGANMYGRISDITNTPSHVLAEFIDNAIQSYQDHKSVLKALEPDYKLRVEVNLEWDSNNENRASKITIRDNAGGIGEKKFVDAFKLAHTPDDNTGLNEYGMGMKTAALWLGETWSVESSAIGEDVSRKIIFDLNRVMADDLKTLPVTHKPNYLNDHYTLVSITSPTKNIPSIKSLQKIKDELASIYRKYLRNNEIQIIVNDTILTFEDPVILTAPFHKKTGQPEGDKLLWRKEIDFRFGKYRANGFIALLNTMQQTKNGLVLLRRGRVVVGAETDGRYFPKALFGSVGSPRYKRMFGELELEGFDVTFNKNDIQDRENLEMLMDALKSVIHTKEFDLYTQADNYREDERIKQIKKIVKAHNTSKDKNTKIEIETNPIPESLLPETPTLVVNEPLVINQYEDNFAVNGIQYTLKVQFVDDAKDLVYLSLDYTDEHAIICNINTNHPYFDQFGKPSPAIIALLKAIAISKYVAQKEGNDSTGELMYYFNQLILKTKV
ncbi:MAG: ATP-binding protein [Bacteroidaceae bacterium]|nr:ATP-binding protein [Bacteroidaceae bacterium]